MAKAFDYVADGRRSRNAEPMRIGIAGHHSFMHSTLCQYVALFSKVDSRYRIREQTADPDALLA